MVGEAKGAQVNRNINLLIGRERGLSMNWQLLNHPTFVVLDLETTGFHPEKFAKITEIGAIKIQNGKMIEQFHTLIDPEVKIPKDLVEKIGISDEMVKGKPTYEEVLPAFHRFIEGAIVVCHNAAFDWDRFLTFYFKKLGIYPTNDVLDTMKIFKALYPDMKRVNLKKMCETLEIPLGTHHRALNDAMVTGFCFLKMKKQAEAEMTQGLLNLKEPTQAMEKIAQTPPSDIYPRSTTLVVMANYWEKAISKKTTYRRIYVSLRDGQLYGRVYLDLTNRTWYNKDFPKTLDFKKVEQATIQFMKLENAEALMSYQK